MNCSYFELEGNVFNGIKDNLLNDNPEDNSDHQSI